MYNVTTSTKNMYFYLNYEYVLLLPLTSVFHPTSDPYLSMHSVAYAVLGQLLRTFPC